MLQTCDGDKALSSTQKHFDGLHAFKRQERMWNMTLTVDGKKPSTHKWWVKCTIYLQDTNE
jgi:hypothetical protein